MRNNISAVFIIALSFPSIALNHQHERKLGDRFSVRDRSRSSPTQASCQCDSNLGLVCLATGQCSCQVGLYTAETDIRGFPTKCSPDRIRPVSSPHNPSSPTIPHSPPYGGEPPPNKPSPNRPPSPLRGSNHGTPTRGVTNRDSLNRERSRDKDLIQSVEQPSYDAIRTNVHEASDSRTIAHRPSPALPNAPSSSYNPNPPKVRAFNPDPSGSRPPYRPVYPADEYSSHTHNNRPEYNPHSPSKAPPIHRPQPNMPQSPEDVHLMNHHSRPSAPPHSYSSYIPQRNMQPPANTYNNGNSQSESHRHVDSTNANVHAHTTAYTQNDRRRSSKPPRRGQPSNFGRDIQTDVHARLPTPQHPHTHTPTQTLPDVTYTHTYMPQYDAVPTPQTQVVTHPQPITNVSDKRRNSGHSNGVRRRY